MKGAEKYSKKAEDKVRAFWKKNNIMQKARARNRGEKTFYFMDGPPYANANIHLGTALGKVLKDVPLRAKRMQGFEVFDRPGYDTHGMPIELQVEKLKGFRTKQDIEEYGVEKFVGECRDFATKYIGAQNKQFDNLGVWMDWQNPYKTLAPEYISAIWWTFKKAFDHGMIYQGLYPVHVCARCETAVAYNEIEYAKQTDTSVYAKFKLKNKENTYLIIWTTTPWTLPGNTGVMAHPSFDYVEAKLSNGEVWVLAKERLQELMDAIEAAHTIQRELKGKELEGLEYENPLAKHLKLPKLENAYRVILSERYVNLKEGTGLVHCAPGHGKEDFDAGKKAGLPAISPVAMNGFMTGEAGKYSGKKARAVDKEITADLEKDNALVYKHPYTHDYPICWRCKEPLLMLSVKQWFISVKKVQKKAIEENKAVNWVPEWMKARMHNWLEGISDWPVTRARYWGAPTPLWLCKKCGKKKVIGTVEELIELAKLPKDFDPHKPFIDSVELECECGSKMKIIPEILDVWFDSGVSSWAALGYPQQKELFEKFWPADLNVEMTEQVRGWWNSQLLCSLISFDKKPYKNIMVHGMVLDMGKKKLSKSAGGALDPAEIIEKHTRDYLRHYLVRESRGNDFSFDSSAFKEIERFYNIFYNTHIYANTYLKTTNFEKPKKEGLETEDKWLLGRLERLQNNVLGYYNNYTPYKCIAELEKFVLEDFSRVYIKLVRDRTKTKTQKPLEQTINHTLLTLLKLMAPITPHFTEHVYQKLKTAKMPESIHLAALPEKGTEFTDEALEKEMSSAQELIQAARFLREKQKMRLRWPLKQLVIRTSDGKQFESTKGIIARGVNVKQVLETTQEPKGNFAKQSLGPVEFYLGLDVDSALRDEWEFMELRRKVQDLRKQKKLKPAKKVEIFFDCGDMGFLKKYSERLEKETNTNILRKKGKMEKLLNKKFYIELNA